MLDRLRSWLKAAHVDIGQLKNEAMVAWIHTLPLDARLDEFLERVPPDMRSEIRASCKAAFDDAGDFLEHSVRPEKLDLERFYLALREYLQPRFPWMNDEAFACLKAYTGWFSWHEGY